MKIGVESIKAKCYRCNTLSRFFMEWQSSSVIWDATQCEQYGGTKSDSQGVVHKWYLRSFRNFFNLHSLTLINWRFPSFQKLKNQKERNLENIPRKHKIIIWFLPWELLKPITWKLYWKFLFKRFRSNTAFPSVSRRSWLATGFPMMHSEGWE